MLSFVVRRLRAPAVAAIAAMLLATISVGTTSAAPAHADAAGPRTWFVQTGTQSPNMAIQGMVFLPGSISINVGDTIVWRAGSGEPHTVTFNAPANAQFNPFAPAVGNGSAFDGSQFVSSAAMANVSAEKAGFPTEQRFSLSFTKAGTFAYICLVHPGMGGTVIVHAAGTPYPMTQRQYDEQSHHQSQRIIATGFQLRARDISASNNHNVFIGDTNMEVGADVMRYMRSTVVIHVGESVTFVNHSAGPHTVTVGPELAPFGVNPWCALDCSGSTFPAQGPLFFGSYAATLSSPDANFNSGWTFTGVSVTITFTHAGEYNYFCALHDYLGMTGRVIVTD